MAVAATFAAALLTGGCSASFSGSLLPSDSSARIASARPSAPLSGEELSRLGTCIAEQAPYLAEDRIDSARVWRTNAEAARAAFKDIVPAYDSEPQEVLLVLLDGEFADQYGLDDGQDTTSQLWFATPTFDTAEDFMPGTGMSACDADLSQAGSPLQGVDESVLGKAQALPVALIRAEPPVAGVRSASP
jgi:hypothetical protein